MSLFLYSVVRETWGQYECTNKTVFSYWTKLEDALWELAQLYEPWTYAEWSIDVLWVDVSSEIQRYCNREDLLVHEEWHVRKALDNIFDPIEYESVVE